MTRAHRIQAAVADFLSGPSDVRRNTVRILLSAALGFSLGTLIQAGTRPTFAGLRAGSQCGKQMFEVGWPAPGTGDLAAAWGNTSCAAGIYIDVGSNVVSLSHGGRGESAACMHQVRTRRSTCVSAFQHCSLLAAMVCAACAASRQVACPSLPVLTLAIHQGVQVRKLYQPQQFPGAAVLSIFDKLFGPAPRPTVCTVGFEPNPKHTPYLRTLNTWFKARGYPAVILTETAVGAAPGKLPFYSDSKAAPQVHEWGASLSRSVAVQGANVVVTNVTVADLAAFVVKVVRPVLDAEERKTGRRPPVAMKLDVEVRTSLHDQG